MATSNEKIWAAYRCLELAQRELRSEKKPITKEDLIRIATQYGNSVKITESDCEKVLQMSLEDLFKLDI